MNIIENYNLSFGNLFKMDIPGASHVNYFMQSVNFPRDHNECC